MFIFHNTYRYEPSFFIKYQNYSRVKTAHLLEIFKKKISDIRNVLIDSYEEIGNEKNDAQNILCLILNPVFSRWERSNNFFPYAAINMGQRRTGWEISKSSPSVKASCCQSNSSFRSPDAKEWKNYCCFKRRVE